jgi:tetratricopeptide (TPR) repeat protein
LLNSAAELYPRLSTPDEKNIYWTRTAEMMEQTEITITDIGAAKSELHTMVILAKLMDISKRMQQFYESETDATIRDRNALHIDTIRKKEIEFASQFKESREKGKEFFYGTARDYSWVSGELDFNSILGALTASEWLERGLQSKNCRRKIYYFTKAIELESSLLPAYINRGVCYDELLQYDKAIADYTTALHIDPLYPLAFNHRGMSYAQIKKTEDALSDFNRALELDPHFVQAYINRATLFMQREEYNQAIADFNKAVKREPDNAALYNRRGICFWKVKNFSSAIIDFNLAVQLRPDFAAAYYNLGCVYWERMEWKNVVTAWERCLELEPDHKYIPKHLPKAKKWARYR